MAVLTVARISSTKQAINLAAAAGGGDSFPNTGKELLAVRNAGAGSITLTVTASGAACDYGVAASTAHDQTHTIPNDSATYLIGPFPTRQFNDTSNRVQLAYSGVTSVTVQALALPPTA